MPKSYFYYSRLIDGINEDISYIGVLFRLLTPIFIGAITEILFYSFNFDNSSLIFSSLAAFGTIFLLVWPDFLNPELISPIYVKKKWKLFGLYLMLLCFFPSLGYIGGKIIQTIILNYKETFSWIDFKSIGNGLIAAFIFWLITSRIMWAQVRAFRMHPTKSDHNGTARFEEDGE